jgi:CAAX protease family protein
MLDRARTSDDVNHVGAQEAVYAGLGQRALAALIDNLVWLILISQIAANIPASVYDDEPIVVGVVFLALFSAWFNYFWLTEWKWGKTIGKAVVGIRVTAEDGGRPGFGPTTVRNLLRLVDVLVIGPLLIANTERRQRLGDRFAHTIVVRDRRPAAAANLNPALAAAAAGGGPVSTEEGTPTPSPPLPPPPPPPTPAVGSSPWKASIGIPEGRWGPLQIVWAVLSVIVLVAIGSAVIGAFDPELDSAAATDALQAVVAVTLIGVAIGFARRGGSLPSTFRDLGLRRFASSALGLAATTFVAYLILAAIYAAIVQPEQEDITRDLGFDEGGLAAVAAAVLIIGAAPLSEEIFFRGFMYGGLRRRLPMWAAGLIAGLIFGALHYTGPDSIGVVPQLAVLGFILAWLYERTGSLWPAILMHALNNALAFVVVTTS